VSGVCENFQPHPVCDTACANCGHPQLWHKKIPARSKEETLHVDKRTALASINTALMHVDLYAKAPGMDEYGQLTLKIALSALQAAHEAISSVAIEEK
jgi:hypothetical protein